MSEGKAFMHRDDSKDNKRVGDMFETPPILTELLLYNEKFEGNILEPCAGNGAMVKVLKEKLNNNISYFDKYYGDNKQDFLEYNESVTNIISNVPYGELTDKMVMHGKSIYTGKMALLLRTNYLSGQKRFFLNVYKELKTVYVYNRMPDLRFPIREDGLVQNTAGIVYAFFVWEKGYVGDPSIKFLDISDKIAGKNK